MGLGRLREASETEAGVRETLAAQVIAWNAGDTRGFMAGYMPSERTTFLSGTKLKTGFTTVAEGFYTRYPQGKMGTLEFTELDVNPLPRGEAAYVLGRYKLTGETQQSGAFTLILRFIGGRYLIVHDHTCADAPPETTSAPAGGAR